MEQIEYMKAEDAPNPLEELPFVAYFSMSRYLDGQVPTQMRPPRYKKGIDWVEILKTLIICDVFATLGFVAGLFAGRRFP